VTYLPSRSREGPGEGLSLFFVIPAKAGIHLPFLLDRRGANPGLGPGEPVQRHADSLRVTFSVSSVGRVNPFPVRCSPPAYRSRALRKHLG
jgi:hypothetical protein